MSFRSGNIDYRTALNEHDEASIKDIDTKLGDRLLSTIREAMNTYISTGNISKLATSLYGSGILRNATTAEAFRKALETEMSISTTSRAIRQEVSVKCLREFCGISSIGSQLYPKAYPAKVPTPQQPAIATSRPSSGLKTHAEIEQEKKARALSQEKEGTAHEL